MPGLEHYFPANYALTFAWGIAVLLGMIGLGRLVARAVHPGENPDVGWGLHAVWGMAAYLFVGAILAACGWFRDIVITALLCGGVAVTIWTNIRGQRWSWAAFAAAPWKMWPAFLVVALTYCAGVVYWRSNSCDDPPAYFYFCEKLLSTGSFDEPFSWRRLASLGGHTLLQCSVAARTSITGTEVFELSLSPVILLGLIVGFRRGILARTQLGLCIALAAVTTPILRVNSASHLTGVVLLVGLFVTLDFTDRLEGEDARRRLRWLALAGFIAAAACSLRAQNVPAALGALGLFWLASWIRDRRPRRGMIIELGCWGGALLLALLPWMIMGYRSNGSPLFPLFPGDNNPDFNPLALNEPLSYRLSIPLQMVLEPAMLPLLLCLFALPDWRRALAARAVAISAVIAALLLAYSVTLAPDSATIPRYVQPLLLAGAISALMAAAASPSPRAQVPAWAMTLLWITVTLQPRSESLWRQYVVIQTSIPVHRPFNPRAIVEHRTAQDLVPKGKRILVCSDFPLFFDQRRNPIWTIDMPNATSPAPGLPFQKPPEETKRYFRDLGIEYVIYTNFTESDILYSRPVWEKHEHEDVVLWRIQAPFYLDFFNTIEGLAASETVIGRVGPLTVVQLK